MEAAKRAAFGVVVARGPAVWTVHRYLLNSQMIDRFLSLVQRPNDINHEYRTDIVHNNMIEDTYSVVWKLETQLIIKPGIIIQEESGEKINEQRRKYLVQG